MLSIPINLDGCIISLVIRIPDTGLKCAGQSKITGQVQHAVSVLFTDQRRIICRSIIHHNIVILRHFFLQFLYNPDDVFSFVVGRNNNQQLLHWLLLCQV